MQDVWLAASEYVPSGQGPPEAVVRPATHTAPGAEVQAPLQEALDKPYVAPNRPAGQAEHTRDPDTLKLPGSHTPPTVVAPTLGQKDPAGHGSHAPRLPLADTEPAGHSTGSTTTAAEGQYRPGVGTHRPLQVDCVRPVTAPYVPAGHRLHTAIPLTFEYHPAEQTKQVALPGGLKDPGPHSPPHAEVFRPVTGPTVPPGHAVHTLAPPLELYRPRGQGSGRAEVAPGGQYVPGVATQGPMQAGLVAPVPVPYVPAGQGAHASDPA